MSSIMQYNGAAVIAMTGKNCVAIASDKRFGIRNQTMGTEMKKLFQINDKIIVGLTGLASDMQTLAQKFRFRTNMYKLREERDISPNAFANLGTSMLYESRWAAAPRSVLCRPVTHCARSHMPRALLPSLACASCFASLRISLCASSLLRSFGPYFSEPVIAGLGPEDKPFLCGMDLLGAQVRTGDFMVAGDCTEALYGLCETLYRPDLEADDLFEVLAQCLLSGVDRDCLAGWGCEVHVLTPEGTTIRHLKGRMD